VQFDEVVEVVERHVQCFLQPLIGHEPQVNEVLLHALALQLQELYFGNDGQVLALFNLVGDELALGGLEGLFLFVGLDALALHVVHKLRGYFRESFASQARLCHWGSLLDEVLLEIDEVDHVSLAVFPCRL